MFNRHGIDKDERALAIEREEIEALAKDRDDELSILERNIYNRLEGLLTGKQVASGPKGMDADAKITQAMLQELPRGQWWQIALKNESAMAEVEAMKKQFDDAKAALEERFEDKVDKLQRGDELPPGVMKMIKVYVAIKRKLQPGDKMPAGMATRVSSAASFRLKTCPISMTAPPSILCSTCSACRAA